MTCPTCGHTTREKKAPIMATSTAALTDAQLYAQFKATAPALDLRFYLQHTAIVPADGYALLAFVTPDDRIVGITRAEFYRRLTLLQANWRAESNARESYASFSAGVQAIVDAERAAAQAIADDALLVAQGFGTVAA